MKKIVIVVCGIIKNKNKFLLTQRAEPRKYRGKWQFAGGGLEVNETIIDCLKREIKEELDGEVIGLVLIPEVFEKKENNRHLILICYLCRLKSCKKKIVLDKETMNYGWFSYQQAMKLDFLELFDKILGRAHRIKY